MSDLEYKVGDYVKVIEDKETNYLGLVGYVVEINPDPLYEYAVWLDGEERWFKESELELVQDGGAKVMKYKVGDRVKNLCVAKLQSHLTTPVGSVGIIIRVDDGDELPYLVRSEDFTNDFWFRESELLLLQYVGADAQEVIENASVKPSAKQYNPLEVQEGGGHYKGKGIQPLEYANANDLNPQKFNVVKYITRHEEKNQVEDLSKVIHYALLEAYFQYGVEGSTELKQRVLKMLGENDAL